jgi:hypothetical protein
MFNHEQQRMQRAQLGLQVIRQLARAGSIIAPRLTGNLLFERFCTPPNSWPGDGPHPAALRTPRRT